MCVNVVLWLLMGLECCLVPSSAHVLTSIHDHMLRSDSPAPDESSNSTYEWFTQQLDHFHASDDQWEQRYWVIRDYFQTGAPVFLYLGGEWEESGFSDDIIEPWEELAMEHNALMFKVEHRFYGKSQPTGGNMTLDDLLYLSTSQALADFANFIVAMNRKYELPQGTRWVAFGCSYSGTLAAWLRYKYPHLVYAAVASSAALLIKVQFPEYYTAVGESVMKFYGSITHNKTMGRKCLEVFKQASREVSDLIKTPEGMNLTIEYFGLSDVITLDQNLTVDENYTAAANVVFNYIVVFISAAVQQNSYLEALEKWEIERFCDTLLDDSLGEVVERYGEIYQIIRSEADPNENQTDLQWNYQVCTELGFFETPENENSLLGNNLQESYYFKNCMEQFGESFTEEFIRRAIDRTNTRYGGLDIDATRVIYVQGSLDPWFPLGLNRTRNPLSPVFVVEGGFHCSDSKPRTDLDSDALRATRTNISHKLMEWLGPTNQLQKNSVPRNLPSFPTLIYLTIPSLLTIFSHKST